MKHKILSNISLNAIMSVTPYVFSFFTLMYVSRVLAPQAFGQISFASSFVGYFIMFAELGMPIYAIRLCASKRDNRRELSLVFNELWSIKVILSIISILLLGLSILMVPKLKTNAFMLLIYGSSIFFQMFGCEWLYRGLEKFRFLALVSFLCKLISFLCIILFIKTPDQVSLYAFLSVITSYGSGLIYFIMAHRYVDVRFDYHINTTHFKPLLMFFMMSFAVSVYSSLDLTMLGFMKSNYEIGLYSIAAKAKSVLALTGGIVWNAILPTATSLWKEEKRSQFESLATKTIALVSLTQTIVAVICIIFAKELLFIVGGNAYEGATLVFRILLLSLLPIGASNILGGQVLIPAGKESRLLIAEIWGAIFNFIANLVLIPKLSIVGAAITTVIAEVIVYGICIYYVRKDLDMDFFVGLVRRILGKIKRIIRTILIRLYSMIKGSVLPFYCPCCDTHLRKFTKGNYDKTPSLYDFKRYHKIDQYVICPVCGSLPRHRILVSYFEKHKTDLEGKRILYFAQEKSVKMWMSRNGISSTTADLFGKADLQIDIQATGLASDSFDIIICNHVLEHVENYAKALDELRRIIKPDGFAILSFPVDPKLATVYEDSSIITKEDRIINFGQNDHLRVFGMDSKELLEKAGFNVMEIKADADDDIIKPVIGPADYDYNVLWKLKNR
ncbi:oligosaccharide flippase family protein [Pseudobutyrivibrio sp. MD2005]|uniref:oligosaccharide flippase family protein n=1 Tax=Pseudobutyrivibrio sp. MD2005 TaxID=1410616 RepID=UPI00048531B4|nr:oligosaccharide flippase family protein [Pseudobutyrivibrio sp. MD2005]